MDISPRLLTVLLVTAAVFFFAGNMSNNLSNGVRDDDGSWDSGKRRGVQTVVLRGDTSPPSAFETSKPRETAVITAPSTSVSHGDCSLSMRESFSFFCEPDEVWEARREKAVKQSAKQVTTSYVNQRQFFQNNWEPEFGCAFEERVGVAGEGGKWLCDPFRIKKPAEGEPPCVIVSIGVGSNFNFENAIHELLPHCEIHSFDHTVEKPPNTPPFVHFHKAGIASRDAPPVYTLSSLLKMTGVESKIIEIFKIDTEGAEYYTIPQIANDKTLPIIRQMLIEIHPNSQPSTHDLFRSIRSMGFLMFHKEPNLLASGVCSEFSFINLDKSFVRPDHVRGDLK